MSDLIHLRLRETPQAPVRVAGLTADALATRTEREIARLPAWIGRQQAELGDLFDVRGGNASRVHIEGALTQFDGIAAGTAGGEMVIEGDAGGGVAAGMSGGTIEVIGNVGADAGVAMAGGTLRVRGDAGDRLGAMLPGASKGMTGGVIVVHGAAGAETGARMRRGLIVVVGNVGRSAVRDLIAGTLIVGGTIAAGAGARNKRGTIVALGNITIPAGYRYACTFSPPHLLVTMAYLSRSFGFAPPGDLTSMLYRRYCGDAMAPAKGEILDRVSG
jgi:formylmethanofuran dehydrogenase subunit C